MPDRPHDVTNPAPISSWGVMNTKSTSATELREIEAFEARYRYDATYMKEMLGAAPEAYRVFAGFLPMAQFRLHTEPDIYFTARITAFREIDCGPCLQLAIRKAREEGVAKTSIQEILAVDRPLDPIRETVRQFACAILSGGPDGDHLRATLLEKLGEAAIVELALAVSSAQVFPVVKRGLGHDQSCAATPLEI